MAGTACGDTSNTECTNADSCDGAGVCLDNHADDGTLCDDDLFCTTTSSCTAGACTGSAEDPCVDDKTCNDDSDMCLPNCGNGMMNPGEECDDGAANSDTIPNACRTDCSEPSCGDGVIDDGEQCDDGADNGTATSICDGKLPTASGHGCRRGWRQRPRESRRLLRPETLVRREATPVQETMVRTAAAAAPVRTAHSHCPCG